MDFGHTSFEKFEIRISCTYFVLFLVLCVKDREETERKRERIKMPRRKAMSFDQKRATIAGIILESVRSIRLYFSFLSRSRFDDAKT